MRARFNACSNRVKSYEWQQRMLWITVTLIAAQAESGKNEEKEGGVARCAERLWKHCKAEHRGASSGARMVTTL